MFDETVCGELLSRITEMSRKVLGLNLVGVYLHGSAAMGCFHFEKSDLDLILVVRDDISVPEKREFLKNLLRLSKEAPAKGIELSIVKREVCNPFVYPTPFELHFSEMHIQWFRENPEDYIEKMRGTDEDLAAHFTVIRKYGRTLFGEEIGKVFGEVPREDYIDSIWNDVKEARRDIFSNPVYVVLNLCRVLAYLQDGQILSKRDGGEWGLDRLPGRFHGLIRATLESYASDREMKTDLPEAPDFADYMLTEIQKCRTQCG